MNKKSNDQINQSKMQFAHHVEDVVKTQVEEGAKRKGSADKSMTIGGLFLIAVFVFLFASHGTSSGINRSDMAATAIEEQIATELPIGTRLLFNDTAMESKDYMIEHDFEQESSTIWVWDYAAEDGDYVQVIVDGVTLGEAFMIVNRPVEFTIPSTSVVQIQGIRDGGGGITYAVRYELNGTTYFNSTGEGERNTYTLVGK